VKSIVIFGICAVLLVEAVAFATVRDALPVVSGVVAAVVLLAVRWCVSRPGRKVHSPAADDVPESLRRWLVRTETLVSRAESTQRDWDRHLRPMLARQFELATGQPQRKDPAAFRAAGEMLFGPQLWAWVDPDNIARSAANEPGPGRAALNDILRRLEKI
jgi:hypothetical protein